MNNNIILIGFMGTGKSTISKELHEKTGRKEIDLDAYITEKSGMTINDIFAQSGETAFRDLESACLAEVLKNDQQIVSCGGGTVLRTGNVAEMKKHGRIILLTATAQTIYNRIRTNTERPLLRNNMSPEYIQELMGKRDKVYHDAADIIICTDGKEVPDIAEEILKHIL